MIRILKHRIYLTQSLNNYFFKTFKLMKRYNSSREPFRVDWYNEIQIRNKNIVNKIIL